MRVTKIAKFDDWSAVFLAGVVYNMSHICCHAWINLHQIFDAINWRTFLVQVFGTRVPDSWPCVRDVSLCISLNTSLSFIRTNSSNNGSVNRPSAYNRLTLMMMMIMKVDDFGTNRKRVRRPCSLCSLLNFAMKLTVRKLESWGYPTVKTPWS